MKFQRSLWLGLLLCAVGQAAEAQQFYNPWRFHQSRQALTDRTINRRLTKRSQRKVTVKRVPKAPSPNGKAKPPARSR